MSKKRKHRRPAVDTMISVSPTEFEGIAREIGIDTKWYGDEVHFEMTESQADELLRRIRVIESGRKDAPRLSTETPRQQPDSVI